MGQLTFFNYFKVFAEMESSLHLMTFLLDKFDWSIFFRWQTNEDEENPQVSSQTGRRNKLQTVAFKQRLSLNSAVVFLFIGF